ncbi:MAG: protein kinase, partial [Myxococcota bacterium]|nr:protein kinase [Myxococcota bacterium]
FHCLVFWVNHMSLKELSALLASGAIDQEEFDRRAALLETRVEEPLASSSRLQEGSRFSHYQIIEEIGSGGMGVVYRARHIEEEWAKEQGGDVAIKVLHHRFSKDEDFRKRFMREASLGRRIQHEQIVSVYEVLKSDGITGVVMQFVPGRTLEEILLTKRLSLEEGHRLLSSLGETLDDLHASKVIHRDVKPANVILHTQTQTPILLDLGLAKEEQSLKHSRNVIGSVEYLAPEQIDKKDVGAASDRYAFGLLCYKVLTNGLPWDGDISEGRIYAIKLQGSLLPLSHNLENVSPQADRLMSRMLSLQPKDRFDRSSDFIEELFAALLNPEQPIAEESVSFEERLQMISEKAKKLRPPQPEKETEPIPPTLVSEIEREIQVLEEDIFSEYTFQLSTAPDIVMPVQKSLSMHKNPSDRGNLFWRFFSFQGTLSQKEFVYSMTPLLILLTFWVYTFGLPFITCFGCALAFPILWSIMSQSARRIRDLSGNAYLVFLYLIPCVNISLLLYLLLASSKTNSS